MNNNNTGPCDGPGRLLPRFQALSFFFFLLSIISPAPSSVSFLGVAIPNGDSPRSPSVDCFALVVLALFLMLVFLGSVPRLLHIFQSLHKACLAKLLSLAAHFTTIKATTAAESFHVNFDPRLDRDDHLNVGDGGRGGDQGTSSGGLRSSSVEEAMEDTADMGAQVIRASMRAVLPSHSLWDVPDSSGRSLEKGGSLARSSWNGPSLALEMPWLG